MLMVELSVLNSGVSWSWQKVSCTTQLGTGPANAGIEICPVCSVPQAFIQTNR